MSNMSIRDFRDINLKDVVYIAGIIFAVGFAWATVTWQISHSNIKYQSLEKNFDKMDATVETLKNSQMSNGHKIQLFEATMNRLEGEFRVFRDTNSRILSDTIEMKAEFNILKRDVAKVLELLTNRNPATTRR